MQVLLIMFQYNPVVYSEIQRSFFPDYVKKEFRKTFKDIEHLMTEEQKTEYEQLKQNQDLVEIVGSDGKSGAVRLEQLQSQMVT